MFALAFVTDYTSRWPQFFADLLKGLGGSGGEAVVDMYLRVLTSIDSEVVDRDISHTPQVGLL